jgi:hypothetical protein
MCQGIAEMAAMPKEERGMLREDSHTSHVCSLSLSRYTLPCREEGGGKKTDHIKNFVSQQGTFEGSIAYDFPSSWYELLSFIALSFLPSVLLYLFFNFLSFFFLFFSFFLSFFFLLVEVTW